MCRIAVRCEAHGVHVAQVKSAPSPPWLILSWKDHLIDKVAYRRLKRLRELSGPGISYLRSLNLVLQS